MAPKTTARAVQTVQVLSGPQDRVVNADGSLAALDQALLSTKVAGRLEKISVDLGSAVKQGQLLAQIEPRDYQLRVKQAEAFLAQARVLLGLPLDGTNDEIEAEKTPSVRQTRVLLEELRATRNRLQTLAKQGIIPQADLDSAEATYQVALSKNEDALEDVRRRQALVAQRRAELEMARQQLTDTAIFSPFDGIVYDRRANRGEYLAASAPVVTVVRMNPLRLRLDIAERDAAQIRIGQKVVLRIEGSTNYHYGEITRLSPIIDELTRVLKVEADVTNPKNLLRPGSFATAEIITGTNSSCIMLPKAAVIVFAGIEKVFIVEEGKAVEKSITTGRWIGELVEITSGLRPGNVVVLAPGNLRSGQTVMVPN